MEPALGPRPRILRLGILGPTIRGTEPAKTYRCDVSHVLRREVWRHLDKERRGPLLAPLHLVPGCHNLRERQRQKGDAALIENTSLPRAAGIRQQGDPSLSQARAFQSDCAAGQAAGCLCSEVCQGRAVCATFLMRSWSSLRPCNFLSPGVLGDDTLITCRGEHRGAGHREGRAAQQGSVHRIDKVT